MSGILCWLGKLATWVKNRSKEFVINAYVGLINIHGRINITIYFILHSSVGGNELQETLEKLKSKNEYLQKLAIVELKFMAKRKECNDETRRVICECLCHYFSTHPSNRWAIDALFQRGSVFTHLEKVIEAANFVNMKLCGSHVIENVNFIKCRFNNCHFHNIHFRHCNMHEVEIRECNFKDEIKFSDCFFKGVQIENSYFRHTQFTDVAFREGGITSSTLLRSELRGVSFFDLNLDGATFQLCEFHDEDFAQCRMNNVRFTFKKNMGLQKIQEYLIHMGLKPYVEWNTRTMVVGQLCTSE